jgi:serine/threonine-protein kinase
MSPEQAQGKPLDARSDLYSLAVILYQMLTGRPPFTDNDAVVVMARHIKSTPKRPNEAVPEAMIPAELEDVIMRTLAKDPKDRPASAEIFAGELLAALEAQGAQTSGVRASITNAAGIRVPESMRPPPVALPRPARRKLPLLLLAVPLVALAAAGGVYLGLSRGSSAPPTPAASAEPPTTGVTSATAATAVATAARTVEPPSFTPDTLPKAPAMAAGASTSGKHPGKAPPVAAPGKGPKAGASARPAGAGTPATSPSSTGGYGIFD